MAERFKVELLDQAIEFIDKLDEKSRDKVIYNIHKARVVQNKDFLRNYLAKYGNFELYITKIISGYLHFGTSQKKLIL